MPTPDAALPASADPVISPSSPPTDQTPPLYSTTSGHSLHSHPDSPFQPPVKPFPGATTPSPLTSPAGSDTVPGSGHMHTEFNSNPPQTNQMPQSNTLQNYFSPTQSSEVDNNVNMPHQGTQGFAEGSVQSVLWLQEKV